MKILITGASGFVGAALLDILQEKYDDLVLLGRSNNVSQFKFYQAEIDSKSDYTEALKHVDVVIHVAARAHVLNEDSAKANDLYQEINTRGTLNLAKQSIASGVKRFIFISSVKVNGEQTQLGKPFSSMDIPSPEDAYGQSKADAEKGLLEISAVSDLEVVIIRPPLVYGRGVKANFASMMQLATKNLPLPFGSIKNKRSMVGIDNLVDLIIACIDHPNAANQIFLVSDDHDVSTSELMRELTIAAGKKPRLIPVPMKIIKFMATLLGKKSIADRLCGSLQVDITHTKEMLGWVPPVSFKEGIARCFKKVN